MKKRQLGKSGLEVSEIGFGCWAIGGNKFGNSYGFVKDEESIAAIQCAIALGCNLFDTADVYGLGRSEEMLGKAIQGYRDKVLLCSKVGDNFYHSQYKKDFSEAYVFFAFKESLQRINTDYLDIYMLHNPTLREIQKGAVFDPLLKLKTEGKIRAVGISVSEPSEGIAAIVSEKVDVIQIAFNMYYVDPVFNLFPLAKKHQIGIMASEVLGNGFLTGKFSVEDTFVLGDFRSRMSEPEKEVRVRLADAYAKHLGVTEKHPLSHYATQFSLSHDAVGTAIVGAKTTVQVEENMAADSGPVLSQKDIDTVLDLLDKQGVEEKKLEKNHPPSTD